jgi:hypothetical protein
MDTTNSLISETGPLKISGVAPDPHWMMFREARPRVFYIALFTRDGEVPTEINGSRSGYVRMPIDNGDAETGDGSGWVYCRDDSSLITNAYRLVWPVAQEDWGHITYFDIYDATVGGRTWFWGHFTPPLHIYKDTEFFIPPGGVAVAPGADFLRKP